ncbi:hypothetical protein HDU98_003567, partial [Podochytrium sp. JEL0797]
EKQIVTQVGIVLRALHNPRAAVHSLTVPANFFSPPEIAMHSDCAQPIATSKTDCHCHDGMDPALDDMDHDDPDQDFATAVDPGLLQPEEESQLPASKRFIFSRTLPPMQTKPTIEFDIGDKFMLDKAKSEVPAVLARIAASWGTTASQLNSIPRSQMLHSWSASILNELHTMMNNCIALKEDRISESDLNLWMTELSNFHD